MSRIGSAADVAGSGVSGVSYAVVILMAVVKAGVFGVSASGSGSPTSVHVVVSVRTVICLMSLCRLAWTTAWGNLVRVSGRASSVSSSLDSNVRVTVYSVP